MAGFHHHLMELPRNCKKTKIAWRFAMLALAWVLWKERNQRVFEGKTSCVDDIWKHAQFLRGLRAAASKISEWVVEARLKARPSKML